ncbi:NAD-dependent epimerase/dehydratase family protein [Alteromonadaceae bacterium BrNp21-10]|nr:NAD-dependent epimerase/dehydratase family protein [Alteromonadaceae bacterium BrNp21-10]
MKVLFIGGTGNISTETSRLCVANGIDLYLLNRGTRKVSIVGATSIVGDINDPATQKKLQSHQWDCVVNWIAFTREDAERDIRLFANNCKQYIVISSASCYQKPVSHPIITESTPLYNPFWEYSRNKIAIEDCLTESYRQHGFPMTIVRPSLTYDTVIPVPFGGWTEYNIIQRIKAGLPIIVHGDGTSLFTITHASDFAKGFVGLIGHQQAIGHAFHITSDESLTWDQIHIAIASAIDCEANIVHIPSDFIAKVDPDAYGSLLGDKAHSVIFDNSKIKQFVPDFCATIPFSKGIKQTLDWFAEDSKRQLSNPKTEDNINNIIQRYGHIAK